MANLSLTNLSATEVDCLINIAVIEAYRIKGAVTKQLKKAKNLVHLKKMGEIF